MTNGFDYSQTLPRFRVQEPASEFHKNPIKSLFAIMTTHIHTHTHEQFFCYPLVRIYHSLIRSLFILIPADLFFYCARYFITNMNGVV